MYFNNACMRDLVPDDFGISFTKYSLSLMDRFHQATHSITLWLHTPQRTHFSTIIFIVINRPNLTARSVQAR
jgi:hypothetical protein